MKAEILDHYGRQFKTLDSLFDKVNDEAWCHEDQRLKSVWQWMTHTLKTIEFYMGDRPPGEFGFGYRFEFDWEQPEPAKIPTMDEMKQYLIDIRGNTFRVLESMSEDDFAAAETVHKWTGATYGAKMLYLLRHTQQHVGDMNRVLAMCGCESMVWH
jgi:hypothetical protein